MRSPHFVVLIAVAAVAAFAWGGSSSKESASTPPSASTDGLSLSEATSCRVSVRVDAGTITAGKIVVSYYDSTLGWVESDSTLHCSVVATRNDGGTRMAYVCPDLQVLAGFGRVAAHSYGVTQNDGGPVKTRLQCYGPTLPNL